MNLIRFKKISFIVYHRLQERDIKSNITSPDTYEYWYARIYDEYDHQSIDSIDYHVKQLMGENNNAR